MHKIVLKISFLFRKFEPRCIAFANVQSGSDSLSSYQGRHLGEPGSTDPQGFMIPILPVNCRPTVLKEEYVTVGLVWQTMLFLPIFRNCIGLLYRQCKHA